MPPHPDTENAVSNLRRQDLLATAEHERHAAATGGAPSPAATAPRPWVFVASAVAALAFIGLAVAPGPLSARESPELVVASAQEQLEPAAYSEEESANLEIAHRFFEELHGEGDLAVAEEIVAPDALFHIPGGELSGPAGIGGLVTLLRTAFPDATFPIEDVAVDGDTVAVRWTMRGTSEGEFQGIPPTGEAVELRGTAFLSIEDGLIVEDWVTYDQLGLLQQLGAMPGAGPEATPEP
ncbi:MAG: ester cyclase [Chloroflexia bacterium]|nr:ester cyclase [Chloroflexia bacterium]